MTKDDPVVRHAAMASDTQHRLGDGRGLRTCRAPSPAEPALSWHGRKRGGKAITR